MSETHAAETHGTSHVKGYFVVFIALAIFTAVSFVANEGARAGKITKVESFGIILGVAVVKAVLVATFFMHLKFDWKRVYFMIVPALILGTMMIIVLLPDIVLTWHHSLFESASP